MIPFIRISAFISFLLLCGNTARSQNVPIGAWESYLPYNSAVGVVASGNTIYTACNHAFFSLNSTSDNAYIAYSKTDGMNDMGVRRISYDVATATLILAYNNSNIDLFKDNTFYNIPALKAKAVAGRKTIYQVYTNNGMAYLATALGIVVIDIASHTITNTIELIKYDTNGLNTTVAVTGFTRAGNYFYAATENGVYKIDISHPHIDNATAWQRIDSTNSIVHVCAVNDNLLLASRKAVFTLSRNKTDKVYSADSVMKSYIRHIDVSGDRMLISEYSDSSLSGTVKVMDNNYAVTANATCKGKPEQAVQMPDNTIWIADSANGLQKYIPGGAASYHFPEGPTTPYAFDIYAQNKELYIAHGEYNGFLGGNFTRNGITYLHDGKWKYYKAPYFPDMANARDIVTLAKDESDGTMYAASFLNGLLVIKPGDKIELIKDNAIFDGSYTYGPDEKQVIGLGLDKPGNLWVTLANANHPLYVKTKNNEWYKFKLPNVSYGGPLMVDDNGLIYFISFSGASIISGGLVVFDPAGTLADTADDASYRLVTGKGYGNLPSNSVMSIAKDRNNAIWVGTANGIGIINNCKSPFSQTGSCEAVIPVVQNSASSGPLFEGKAVYTIAVDAANRKWIGTDKGAWLLSADGQTVISNFTTENSPLPSDRVQKISIDKVTGDVYFGTYMGLVSYRSAITEPATSNEEPIIFPNPVPAAYKGSIAIKGLMTNTDIRITDVNGQLVYHGKVQAGGQFIWDGNDYTGRRPQSGVYLVFMAGADGKQTAMGKLVFLQ